jgi:hypothetical protein
VAVRDLREVDAKTVADIFNRINSTDYALKATERYNALVKLLNGYYNGIPSPLAIELYNDWEASNRVCWPFPGSRLDQPEWVLYAFRCLELRREFYPLRAKVITLTTAPPLKP